ncbi:MAG: AAA family ATPase [Atopobiaceae bacterium]|nr:AAA family ATPase [Atopobiaceae bacterium]MDY5274774.1 AAA family ATPase [Atopobiaceae bacterium]
MKLLSLTVGGFKNLSQTTIELDGITAFVSPNNYGKSNLLDAIDFGIDFINESPKGRNSMMGYVPAIPLVPELSNEHYHFEVEFEDEELGEYRFVKYGFSFAWIRDDGTGQTITDETLQISSQNNGRWTNYLKRKEGKYRKGHDTRSFRSISLDGNQLAIDVLTAIEDIEINPAIKKIKKLGFSLCTSLDASLRFRPTPIEAISDGSMNNLADFDDSDIPRAMYRLKANHKDRYDELLSALFTLFPEFQEISVNPYELKKEEHDALEKSLHDAEGDDKIPFRIRDELYRITIRSSNLNQPVNVNMMSTGTKRIIWLLTNVVMASVHNAPCLGVEEIETSIHPKMLQQLLEILDENIDETALLVTSHSPFLIQYLQPSQIYLGVPNDNGVAKFKRIRKDALDEIESLAYDRGLGFGTYLFELMSSDGEDAEILANALEE